MSKTRLALPLAATALFLSSCGDDPASPPLTSISIDFCASEPALWFAYQNEGAAWTQVEPDANATVTFHATPKVSIAYVRARRGLAGEVTSGVNVSVLQATSEQLETLSGVACVSEWGTRSISTTRTGLGQFETAYIGAHRSERNAFGAVPRLPDSGPLDFFGIRRSGNDTPLSVIIRRGVTTSNGGSIPVFDFASSEAVPIVQTNLAANLPLGRTVNFWMNTGPGQVPTFVGLSGSGAPPATFPSIPASLLIPGDVHELEVGTTTGGTRGVKVLYREPPSDLTVTFGAPLAAMTVNELVSPTRYRLVMASQAEYGGMVVFAVGHITMTSTAAYHGQIPSTWDLTTPDFSGVAGWNSAWSPQAGAQPSVTVAAFETPAIVLQPVYGSGTFLGFDRMPYPVNTTVRWGRHFLIALSDGHYP